MSQPLTNTAPTKKQMALNKLKKVIEECSHIKTELNSIKNLTFKAKRKLDISIKQVRDTVRHSLTKRVSTKRSDFTADFTNKQNNMNSSNTLNNLANLSVKLPQQKNQLFQKQNQQEKLRHRIMLQLQEIKLLEQRENLICKKNQRMMNYYSQNKKQIDIKRSQVL